eukprot:SAG22_NODE_1561_length_4118_cov_4.512814_1_plen_196_part_00
MCAEYVQVRALEDLPKACKVQLRYKTGAVTRSASWSSSRSAAAPAATAAAAGPARSFVLLIMKNETVQNTEKVVTTASTLAALTRAVAEQCGLGGGSTGVVLTKVADAAATAVPIETLDQIKDKDKLMVWPAGRVGDGAGVSGGLPEDIAAAAEPEGPPRYGEKRSPRPLTCTYSGAWFGARALHSLTHGCLASR